MLGMGRDGGGWDAASEEPVWSLALGKDHN